MVAFKLSYQSWAITELKRGLRMEEAGDWGGGGGLSGRGIEEEEGEGDWGGVEGGGEGDWGRLGTVCEVVTTQGFKSSRRSSSCIGCRKSAPTPTWPAGSASGAQYAIGCSTFSSGMGNIPQTPHDPHTPGWSSFLKAQRCGITQWSSEEK